MKVEKERFVLTLECNGENRYLTSSQGLVEDICEASMFKSNIVAADVKDECFEEYDLDLKIIPLKITYEW